MTARTSGLILAAIALTWTGTALAGQSDKDDPPQIVRSTDCVRAFKHYVGTFFPYYFALSEDGTACGYTYCISTCAKSFSPYAAIMECENVSNGQSCSVYALHGRVVSKTGVTPGGGAAGE